MTTIRCFNHSEKQFFTQRRPPETYMGDAFGGSHQESQGTHKNQFQGTQAQSFKYLKCYYLNFCQWKSLENSQPYLNFIDFCLFLRCLERLVDLQQEILSALFTEYLLFCGVMGKLRATVVGNLSQMKVNCNAWAL